MLLLQVTLGFFAIAGAVALAGEGLLPLAPAAPELRGVARFVLGTAAWMAGLFVLAATGLLALPGIAVLALLLAAPALVRGRRAGKRPADDAPPAPPSSRGERLLVAAVAAGLLLPFGFLAATPPVGWDDAVYHLALPRLFLEAGGFRPVPFNVYASWPLGGELLYAAALAIGPHPTAKLVHFGFGLLVLYALVAALRGRGLLAGATAGALWIANPVVGFELRVAYVDLMTAFAFLAGGLFLARAATDEDERSPHLLLAGVAAGVAVATKVTGVLAAAVLLALHGPRLVAAVRAGLGREAVRAVALRFGMPVVAAGVPWLVKARVETGNPVYPLFHGLLGGAHWSDDLTARLAAWQRSIGMGREPLDYLLLPLRVLVAGGEGYARFDGRLGAFWVVLVPLALLLGLRLPPVRRALAAAGLFFAAWAATAQQMRFLIPAVPFLALAVAETAAERVGRLASSRARAAARVALFLAAAGLVVATNGPVLAAGWRVLPVLLRGDPAALLASAVPEVWRFVDAELAPDAKLLLLGTNRVFDCRREAIADSFFEASQIVDWLSDAAGPEEVARRLAAEGVTHVLVERRPGPSYPSPLLRLLDDPARAAAVFRSADDRHLVFALRSPAAEEGR